MKGMPFLSAPLFPWLIVNVAALYTTLLTPTLWSRFANEDAFHLLVLIFQAAKALNIPYSDSKTYYIPSETVTASASMHESQNLTEYGILAVVGADNFVDIEDHIVMKDVLDELVDITRTVTPTCE